MTKEQNCGSCRYAKPLGAVTDIPGDEPRCHRYPPKMHIYSNSNEMTTFPVIRDRWWCGEYAPTNPETISEGATTMARLILLGDLTAARALADRLKEDE